MIKVVLALLLPYHYISMNKQDQNKAIDLIIIDDDYALRDALEDYYSKVGFNVSVFSEGKSFLKVYPKSFSGVIICDLRMPEMTGLEVLKTLNEHHMLPSFILMTAYGDIPSAVEAMHLGAYDFIEKPFDPAILEEKIREAIQKQKIIPEKVSLEENKRFREYVANFEKSLLEQALHECRGNIGKVCDLLKIPRRTLNEKLVKHGLNRENFLS